MKITTLILCPVVFTLCFVHFGECRNVWFPNVLAHFTNRTTQITDYVKERGRNFKKYYFESLRDKFNAYLGTPEGKAEALSYKDTLRSKRRFNFSLVSTTTTTTDNYIEGNEISQEVDTICSDDDPMNHMTTPQLLAANGYPAQSHTIVTDDGYILTIHRIPFRNNTSAKEDRRKTVLLHHGLLGSSADWLLAGPGKSLGYILSDAGYDVWLANARGNTYSRAHVSRLVDTYAFWNFTFHDIGQHDLPAVIDYIMDMKGWDVKINYIGHSMGTTALFVLLSTKPQYNKILRAGFALAPVAYMTDIKSPITMLARFANNIQYLMKLFGANEFLPQNVVIKWLSRYACEINNYEEAICENSLFVLCGHDPEQFNRSLLPIILSHVPAGASTKTLVHYAQIIHNTGRFQQFDYGTTGNIAQYGTVRPPEYPIHQISLPIALLSAENDWLAGDVDVSNLFVQLMNPIEHYIVPYKEFNHVDFLWAKDAPKLVYDKLIELLDDGVSTHTYFNPDLISVTDSPKNTE